MTGPCRSLDAPVMTDDGPRSPELDVWDALVRSASGRAGPAPTRDDPELRQIEDDLARIWAASRRPPSKAVPPGPVRERARGLNGQGDLRDTCQMSR